MFKVDCQITLRSNKDPKGTALQNNFVFRQNENKELVINGKLPEQGLYALDIHGKKLGSKNDKMPVVASYLIASSSGAIDKSLYPKLHRQLAGQTEENLGYMFTIDLLIIIVFLFVAKLTIIHSCHLLHKQCLVDVIL